MQLSTLSVYIYVLEDIENSHFSKLCVLFLVPNLLVLFIYNYILFSPFMWNLQEIPPLTIIVNIFQMITFYI